MRISIAWVYNVDCMTGTVAASPNQHRREVLAAMPRLINAIATSPSQWPITKRGIGIVH